MINTHPLMLDEILNNVNKSDNVVLSLRHAYFTPYVKPMMELATSDQWISIDIANVNFKDYNYHRSMAGAFLLNRQSANIIFGVMMNSDAKDASKLVQYKALMEMLFADEAVLLKHILTKDLTSIYKNITHELIVESLAQ